MSIENDVNPKGSREANGRFAEGNPGGRGNPFGRRLCANRAAILNVIGPEEIEQVMAALMKEALAGDLQAAKLILQYAVGKPAAAKEPDRVDVDEFEVAKAKRVPHSEAVIALLDMPVEKATAMAGQTPIMHDDPEQDRLDELEEQEEALAEKAAKMAEAKRNIDHLIQHGEFPADSVLAPPPVGAEPAVVESYNRVMFYLGKALKGEFPEGSPFQPCDDGSATLVAERATVCAAM